MSMIIATLSDRFRMRYVFIMIPFTVAVAGYAVLISIHHDVNVMYAALFLAVAGNLSAMPVIICWFNTNCKSLMLELTIR